MQVKTKRKYFFIFGSDKDQPFSYVFPFVMKTQGVRVLDRKFYD